MPADGNLRWLIIGIVVVIFAIIIRRYRIDDATDGGSGHLDTGLDGFSGNFNDGAGDTSLHQHGSKQYGSEFEKRAHGYVVYKFQDSHVI